MRPRDAYMSIPTLKIGTTEVTDNREKAEAFLEAFFPEMADPEEEEPGLWQRNCPPIRDGIPTLVRKHLWIYLKEFIKTIFTRLVDLGYYPNQWKQAWIVVLRNPGKSDYSAPGAYRPISLLNTLGKLLEAVMARRLLYWAEKYGLLPDMQSSMGCSRVVTLIAFDLKAAFNGVHQISLDARLKAKGIPLKVRQWISSFMAGWQASVMFDDFETDRLPLENAGLAQGSPLSPIL
ncbi:putative 115 kDa protein in type-1 retrotransposable element R1DM [Aspergillus awamori]|uniref:Putative 115 kDa protein in type-1 retrotransposable element R1DM n=1 Tax=Aspergillus awamori TaxID=105351 RepID=A0A401KYD9_ASPAW|nr:putative 115 kDa protein in type-1 retrotransposable element R1DM [Aspergillus awamori]